MKKITAFLSRITLIEVLLLACPFLMVLVFTAQREEVAKSEALMVQKASLHYPEDSIKKCKAISKSSEGHFRYVEEFENCLKLVNTASALKSL